MWSTTGRPHVRSEGDDEVVPVFLLGPLIEATFDALNDLPELAVIKGPDEDDAGMCALRLGPFSGQRREVAAVAGDKHTVLARGKFEYRGIVEPFQRGLFSEGEHVVSGGAQTIGDPTRGEVGVEQQPHEERLRVRGEVHEGVELQPVIDGPPVLGNRASDLLGISIAVSERETHLAFVELGLLDQPRN